MAFGDAFRLTLLTNDPERAAEADAAGVDRVGVDLEWIGKSERQPGLDARISAHTLDDLGRVAPSVTRAELFARINPIHAGTADEIEAVLSCGAQSLLLPHFETVEEVAAFVAAVRGRARVAVLLETAAAATRVREILAVRGIDEVVIGLNDLHLQMRVANHFELLASPLLEMLASEARRRGLPVGIGGIGRVDDHSLPIPSDLVYAQYPRLRATGAWLARSFVNSLLPGDDLGAAVRAARTRLSEWGTASAEELEQARDELARVASGWQRT
jgi:hypothetical protein